MQVLPLVFLREIDHAKYPSVLRLIGACPGRLTEERYHIRIAGNVCRPLPTRISSLLHQSVIAKEIFTFPVALGSNVIEPTDHSREVADRENEGFWWHA
jgi:hypothetical protein